MNYETALFNYYSVAQGVLANPRILRRIRLLSNFKALNENAKMHKKWLLGLVFFLCGFEKIYPSDIYEILESFSPNISIEEIKTRWAGKKINESREGIIIYDVEIENFFKKNELQFRFQNGRLEWIALTNLPDPKCVDATNIKKRSCRIYEQELADYKKEILKKFRKTIGPYEIASNQDYPQDKLFVWKSIKSSYRLYIEYPEDSIRNLRIVRMFSDTRNH